MPPQLPLRDDDDKAGPSVDFSEVAQCAFGQNRKVTMSVKVEFTSEPPKTAVDDNIEEKVGKEDTSGKNDDTVAAAAATVVDDDDVDLTSDLWSAAYREAVKSLGQDINSAILKGENVAELFKQLEDIDNETTNDSAYLRGVNRLKSIKKPLERFKQVLDMAAPFASIDPTASTVVGVVRGVTAVSQ